MSRETPERFASHGLRTGSPADALQPGEFIMLKNVREITPTEITCRPGHRLKFATENNPVKNISSYTQGATPRFLAAVDGNIYLDDGTVVDSGYTSPIPSMVPFRPSQSPESWIYIGDQSQYRKLSSPPVTAQNVGIVEPQDPPGISLGEALTSFLFPGDPFTNSGQSGAVSTSSRTVDTIQAVFTDPLATSGTGTDTLQVSTGVEYQREMLVKFNNGSADIFTRVNDVFTPLPPGIDISGIEYYAGNTGLCVVVPVLQAPGPGQTQSIFEQAVMANLRRGALVQIGTEVCYVYDVETGPLGTVCFTTFTQVNHTAAEQLSGVPAIQIFHGLGAAAGQSLTSQQWTYSSNNGIGTIQTLVQPSIFVANGTTFEPDDYVHFSVNVDDLSKLNEIKIVFDVNDGPITFTENAYFYAVRPSDIAAGVANALTQLGVAQLYAQRQLIDEESQTHHNVPSSAQTLPGSSQWSEIVFRLKDMIRIGNDQSQTLANMQAVQFVTNANGAVKVKLSSITVHGQRQQDVGQFGHPYRYRVRGRSSVTGAKSNPSPASRYGWSPRRQVSVVYTPAPPDPQMDLWDIFRIGGTLDSYRLVGTIPTGLGAFTDNYNDLAIAEAEVLEFDNLQPWPTLDLPLNVPSGVSVNGTIVKFTAPAGSSVPNILRYLPGNIVRLNETAYTLFNRPTAVGNVITMSLVDNADVATNDSLFIYEPLMANQHLPFVWGPTAEGGTIFAVGDPNRPGTVYFAKNFNPDSAPDKYNLELSPPSEPLVGGLLHAGTSLAFSNSHWWELRPSFGGVNKWTARLLPVPAGCVSHFAACSDGEDVYFVGKDGVYSFRHGLITPREQIYTLFPHEGVTGKSHSALAETVPAPDFEQVSKFRLCCANGFLYFDYIPQVV